MKTEYVAGFLFRERFGSKEVALVKKARPEWQAGKMNGVGGKIEAGETPHEAMKREWQEETGWPQEWVGGWRQFATLHWNEAVIHFFTGDIGNREGSPFRKDTDEKVYWCDCTNGNAPTTNLIPNLKWLIPLSLDKDSLVAVIHDPSAPK